MPSVICASALLVGVGASGLPALVFTARTYVVQGMNVKQIDRITNYVGGAPVPRNNAVKRRVPNYGGLTWNDGETAHACHPACRRARLSRRVHLSALAAIQRAGARLSALGVLPEHHARLSGGPPDVSNSGSHLHGRIAGASRQRRQRRLRGGLLSTLWDGCPTAGRPTAERREYGLL